MEGRTFKPKCFQEIIKEAILDPAFLKRSSSGGISKNEPMVDYWIVGDNLLE